MKTRIIYGGLLGLGTVLLLIVGSFLPIVFNMACAVLAALAIYELLNNTGFCKSDPLLYVGMGYAFLCSFLRNGLIPITTTKAAFVFIAVQFVLAIVLNKNVNAQNLLASIFFPLAVGYSLRSLSIVLSLKYYNIFYFLLIVCFTVFADMGAYFIGVFFGKHKMAPHISPNKTYEGLIGGFGIGMLATFIVCVIFKYVLKLEYIRIWYIMLLSPLFIALGVLGDLIASYFKRQSNIKDYGSVIPGHGGVMDRLDSFLLVGPAFYLINGMLMISGNW